MNWRRETVQLGTRLSQIPIAGPGGAERSETSANKMGVLLGNRRGSAGSVLELSVAGHEVRGHPGVHLSGRSRRFQDIAG